MISSGVQIVTTIFFIKNRTAYMMRISNWSSDVCSSDLKEVTFEAAPAERAKVVDLMAALEASVDAAKSAKGRKSVAKAMRKAADDAREAAKAADEKDDDKNEKGKRKKTA